MGALGGGLLLIRGDECGLPGLFGVVEIVLMGFYFSSVDG